MASVPVCVMHCYLYHENNSFIDKVIFTPGIADNTCDSDHDLASTDNTCDSDHDLASTDNTCDSDHDLASTDNTCDLDHDLASTAVICDSTWK